MKHRLPENIKKYRKYMDLTQEQLAEAVGVTVGTVSKWENGNCLPDLTMIMELADFFEVSMDVLTGYETSGKKAEDIVKKVHDCFEKHNMEEAVSQCNKALQKYTNNFDVLMVSARTFYLCGYENKDEVFLARAKELYLKAQKHIPEDEKKAINELHILHELALFEKDEKKHIDALKQININHMYNLEIGDLYRQLDDLDHAYEFFADGFYYYMITIINTVGHWVFSLVTNGRSEMAIALLDFCVEMLKRGYDREHPGFSGKLMADFLTSKAILLQLKGEDEPAKKWMKKAIEQAQLFDKEPSNDVKNGALFYVSRVENASMYAFDEHGPGAVKGIYSLITECMEEYKGKGGEQLEKLLLYYEESLKSNAT